MKEERAARKEQWTAKQRIEEEIAFYDDRFRFGEGGEDGMGKKEVTFQREQLYEEIWTHSLSKVAKKYDVPYQKLKDACEAANIPLPSQSYWGNLYIGKPVPKKPLPESTRENVTVTFSVRTSSPVSSVSKTQLQTHMDNMAPPQEKGKAAVPETAETITPPPKSAYGGNLYERKTLYDEVWQQPVTKVAERYGVSDVMIHKVCKAMNIPVPPRGYWAKKAAGQPVEQEPLPEHIGKTAVLGKKTENDKDERTISLDRTLDFLEEEERLRVIKTALQLRVDPTKGKLHPVLTRHKAAYATWAKSHPRDPYAAWNRDTYRRISNGEPPLYERVSADALPRLYYILDALYGAVEELGGSVNQDLSVQIRGERVVFEVLEGREKTKHVLSKDELRQLETYEKEKESHWYASKPKIRQYDYLPTGRLTFSAYRKNFVRDSAEVGLESRVGELLLGLYIESEAVRIEREAREEAKRKAEEEARQKELRRQRYNEEVDRLAALKREADDYQVACKIRAYVAAVESKPDLDPSQLEWIAWAKAKADWYDPTMETVDPIFGKRDHSKPDDPEKISPRWW